jgi:hypothetical protein
MLRRFAASVGKLFKLRSNRFEKTKYVKLDDSEKATIVACLALIAAII